MAVEVWFVFVFFRWSHISWIKSKCWCSFHGLVKCPSMNSEFFEQHDERCCNKVQRLHWKHCSHSCICWSLLEDVGLVTCWVHRCLLYCDSTLPLATQSVSLHNIHTDVMKWEPNFVIIKMSQHTATEWSHFVVVVHLLCRVAFDKQGLKPPEIMRCSKKGTLIRWFVFGTTWKLIFKFCNRLLNDWEEDSAQLTCSGFLWISQVFFSWPSLF